MQLAMIGLGKMGGNMVRRLLQGGHEVVVFDRSAEAIQAHAKLGAPAPGVSRGAPGGGYGAPLGR